MGDREEAAEVLSAPDLRCRSKAAQAKHTIYPWDKLLCGL